MPFLPASSRPSALKHASSILLMSEAAVLLMYTLFALLDMLHAFGLQSGSIVVAGFFVFAILAIGTGICGLGIASSSRPALQGGLVLQALITAAMIVLVVMERQIADIVSIVLSIGILVIIWKAYTEKTDTTGAGNMPDGTASQPEPPAL